MNAIDIFLEFIGFCTSAWWLFGLVLLMFFTPVYVAKGAPFGSKIAVVLHSPFVLPYLLFVHGVLPAAMITPAEPDADEQKRIDAFLQKLCPCEKCRRRRGEIE